MFKNHKNECFLRIKQNFVPFKKIKDILLLENIFKRIVVKLSKINLFVVGYQMLMH